MSTLRHNPTSVQTVFQERPYLRWDLVPLAAVLCEEGYSDHARNRIIDSVIASISLEDLVGIGWLEPADLATARNALAMGRERAWRLTLAPVCGAAVDPGPDVDGDRWGLGSGGDFPREMSRTEKLAAAQQIVRDWITEEK